MVEGKFYLDSDMEKPGSSDHFPEVTACNSSSCINVTTELQSVFNNSSINNSNNSYDSSMENQEALIPFLK